MRPRVTVLMAVHNGEPHLRAAVESVLAQTYPDFELLIVDDGSTDGSADVVRSYEDRRIRLLENERNLGQIPSLNRALREAHGEYVARLDHDDLCLPERLERQVEELDAEPSAALAGTWIDVVDEDGRLWATVRGDIATFVDFVAAILVNQFPFGHPSIMFRREIALELGGYDESLGAAEDLDLYRRLALARHEVRVVRAPLVLYRRHVEQMSQAKSHIVAESDAFGHERFIAELAPAAPAGALRLLLTGGEGLWRVVSRPRAGHSAARGLSALVEGASVRLDLTQGERAELERFLSRRVAQIVRRGWREALISWWLGSPPLLCWAFRHAPGARRLLIAAYGAAYLLAPLLRLVFYVQTRATRAFAHLPLLASVRRRARQSRTLRLLYSRLAGR